MRTLEAVGVRRDPMILDGLDDPERLGEVARRGQRERQLVPIGDPGRPAR